ATAFLKRVASSAATVCLLPSDTSKMVYRGGSAECWKRRPPRMISKLGSPVSSYTSASGGWPGRSRGIDRFREISLRMHDCFMEFHQRSCLVRRHGGRIVAAASGRSYGRADGRNRGERCRKY